MTYQRFTEIIGSFPRRKVLVLGDIMVDEFLWGKVSRISPEAPVPIVEVQKETCYAGGAANVARNLTEFTSHVSILGLVGQDAGARKMRELLDDAGVTGQFLLEDPEFQTVVKTRVIARSQQMVRVDRERRYTLNVALREEGLRLLDAALASVDAVIVEDYGKGLLTQEFADEVCERIRKAGKLLLVDPNPRNPIHWSGATVMKPNRHEAFAAAGQIDEGPVEPVLKDEALLSIGRKLLQAWNCEMALVTLSEHGMLLFQRDAQAAPYHAMRTQQVFDVSGAGDTVIALFTLALASGATPEECVEIAVHASSIVVEKIGTATLTSTELLNALAEKFQ
jgi:rfaE bifunctional protein kinase chain/domain